MTSMVSVNQNLSCDATDTFVMFLRLRQWLDPLLDICLGVDVAQLRVDVEVAFAALRSLGEKRVEEFDRGLLKAIQYSR